MNICKKLFIFLIILFNFLFVHARSEEFDFQEKASYTYMHDSVYNRRFFYQNKAKTVLAELKQTLPEINYTKIINNQNILMQYEDALYNGEIEMLNNTLGIMFQTFAQNALLNLNRTNYEMLFIINNKDEQYNSLNNYSIKTKQKELDKLLKEIQDNVSSEKYKRILESQKAWYIYLNDVKKNILSMIKDDSSKQYIIQTIYENRLSVMKNICNLWY